MRISSTPAGSEIYLGEKMLGVTPLAITSEKLGEPKVGGYLLQLRSEGYNRVWVWIPSGIDGLDMAVNMTPFHVTEHVDGSLMSNADARKSLYRLSDTLLKIQTALLVGAPFDKKQLETLVHDYEEVGGIQFLAAVAALRANDAAKAGQALTKAITVSPREQDFSILYQELERAGKIKTAAKEAKK